MPNTLTKLLSLTIYFAFSAFILLSSVSLSGRVDPESWIAITFLVILLAPPISAVIGLPLLSALTEHWRSDVPKHGVAGYLLVVIAAGYFQWFWLLPKCVRKIREMKPN